MRGNFNVPNMVGFRIDESGFSPAYFPMNENPVVSSIEISQLAEITLPPIHSLSYPSRPTG